MLSQVIAQVRRVVQSGLQFIRQKIRVSTKPNTVKVAVEAVADLARTKGELIAENALLRQQLVVLQRSVKRPKLTTGDRWLVVLVGQWVASMATSPPDYPARDGAALTPRLVHRAVAAQEPGQVPAQANPG